MKHSSNPLESLGLKDINAGVWSGGHGWSTDTTGSLIESTNPATGQRLAQVRGATAADYEHVMAAAATAAAAWRAVPAPKRGEAVRLIGEELRAFKDALGSLVSLENGKIKAEGDGEVQEMIDIADFAVGQSRMLYGSTMHSERAQHRMDIGGLGVINKPDAGYPGNKLQAVLDGLAASDAISPGMVAENSMVCCRSRVSRTMRSTSGRKPRSSILSASSSTRARTLLRSR